MRSVKKVSEKVNKGHHCAFTTIGYAILHAKSRNEVASLFSVLCGEKNIDSAIAYIPDSVVLKEYESQHSPDKWEDCANW